MGNDIIRAIISGDEPYAQVSIENRTPPYGHITLRVMMPEVCWNEPRVVIELSAQVGSDCDKEESFMRPYAIRAGIACFGGSTVDLASAEAGIKLLRQHERLKTTTVDLASAEAGIKLLRQHERLKTKYEAGMESPATFPALAQMLLVACKCDHLIHEPDIGWDKWPHDLTMKAMSSRGEASLRVFEKMVATLEDFARNC